MRAAAERVREQRERRRHGSLDQVRDGAPNQAAQAELRIRQRTGDGNVDVDLAARVLQQGNRETHGQVRFGVVLDVFAERQLIDEQMVFRGELVVLELVVQIDVQAALLDRVTRVF